MPFSNWFCLDLDFFLDQEDDMSSSTPVLSNMSSMEEREFSLVALSNKKPKSKQKNQMAKKQANKSAFKDLRDANEEKARLAAEAHKQAQINATEAQREAIKLLRRATAQDETRTDAKEETRKMADMCKQAQAQMEAAAAMLLIRGSGLALVSTREKYNLYIQKTKLGILL